MNEIITLAKPSMRLLACQTLFQCGKANKGVFVESLPLQIGLR